MDVLGNIAGPPLSLISSDSAKIHVQKSTRITQALSRPRQDGTWSYDSPAPSTTHFSIIGFADNSALTVLARFELLKIDTEEQPGDVFTKPLKRPRFQHFCGI